MFLNIKKVFKRCSGLTRGKGGGKRAGQSVLQGFSFLYLASNGLKEHCILFQEVETQSLSTRGVNPMSTCAALQCPAQGDCLEAKTMFN